MGLPDGEVHLHEVMQWAQEQSMFLRSPATRLVLWYLCVNAWRHEDNRQGAEPGEVVSKATSLAAIQRGTGVAKKTAQRSLEELQEEGFLVADLKPGYGKNRIILCWNEHADQRRADYRAGIRDLPKGFKKEPKAPREPRQDAVVINFPLGSK